MTPLIGQMAPHKWLLVLSLTLLSSAKTVQSSSPEQELQNLVLTKDTSRNLQSRSLSDETQSPSPSASPTLSPTLSPSPTISASPSICVDEPGWTVGGASIYQGMTCADIINEPEKWCDRIDSLHDSAHNGKSSKESCCVCNGSQFQSIAPSSSPTAHPSISDSPTTPELPSSVPSSQPTSCIDDPNWFLDDEHDLSCSALKGDEHCERFKDVRYKDKTLKEACCLCGGGIHKSVEPSAAPSSTPSLSPSSIPTQSIAPSQIPSVLPSAHPSVSAMPSSFPSVTKGTIHDREPCKYDGECMSGVCDDENLCEAKDLSFFSTMCYNVTFQTLNRVRGASTAHYAIDDYGPLPNECTQRNRQCTLRLCGIRGNKLHVRQKSDSDDSWVFRITQGVSHPLYWITLIGKDSFESFDLTVPSNPSHYYVGCGDRQQTFCPENTRVVAKTDLYAVRCCSDEAIPGWVKKCENVWAESDLPSCYKTKTYSEAESICRSKNARLCTLDEVHHRRCTITSGCMFDRKLIWTSTVAPTYTMTQSGPYKSSNEVLDGGVHVDDSNSRVTMYGSVSKGFMLQEEYFVTKLTKIEFEFQLEEKADSHMICLDYNLVESLPGDKRVDVHCLVIAGSDIENLDETKVRVYVPQVANEGATKHKVSFLVKELFPSASLPVRYISFVQRSSTPLSGQSSFTKLKLYEDTFLQDGSCVDANANECKCNDGFMATRRFGGYTQQLVHSGDFCIGVSHGIYQMSQNDGDWCTVSSACKSGLCSGGVCSHIPLHVMVDDEGDNLSLAGNYGDNDDGGATFSQSHGNGGVTVQDDGRAISLFGNTWKAFQLSEPFSVNSNTKIELSYRIIEEAELHAVCFDEDMNEDTFGGSEVRCIGLGGSEYDSMQRIYKPEGVDKAQVGVPGSIGPIGIGSLFSSKNTQINFITFIQDSDSSSNVGLSVFENIKLYDKSVEYWWKKQMMGPAWRGASGPLYARPNKPSRLAGWNRADTNKKDLSNGNLSINVDKTGFLHSFRYKTVKAFGTGRKDSWGVKASGVTDLHSGDATSLSDSYIVDKEGTANFKTVTISSDEELRIIHHFEQGTSTTSGDLIKVRITMENLSDTKFLTNVQYRRYTKFDKKSTMFSPVCMAAKSDSMMYYEGAKLGTDCSNGCDDPSFNPTLNSGYSFKDGKITFAFDLQKLPPLGSHTFNMFLVGAKTESSSKNLLASAGAKATAITSTSKCFLVPVGSMSHGIGFDTTQPSDSSAVRVFNDASFRSIKGGKLSAPTPALPASLFGYVSAVSWNGDALVIAAPGYDNKKGRLYLYKWLHFGSWFKSSTISGSSANQLLGSRGVMIAPDKSRVYAVDSNRREYIYTMNTGTFLKSGNAGNRLLSNPSRRADYVANTHGFTYDSNNDRVQVSLTGMEGFIDAPEGARRFGWRIAYSSSKLQMVISAPNTNYNGLAKVGAIYVFQWSADKSSWQQQLDPLYGSEENAQLGAVGVEYNNDNGRFIYVTSLGDKRMILKLLREDVPCAENAENTAGSKCKCVEGYLASNSQGSLTQIVDPLVGDLCVPSFDSPLIDHEEQDVEITLGPQQTPVTKDKVSLSRQEQDTIKDFTPDELDPKLTITGQKYTIDSLLSGNRYSVTFEMESETVTFPIVPTCSCDGVEDNDRTGRPRDLVITQQQGHVLFEFVDKSRCEEAFSFTRLDDTNPEFRDSFGELSSSFTGDYIFSGADECDIQVKPEKEASDDLVLSGLIVGRQYWYCVRAVKAGVYMDLTLQGSESRTSSAYQRKLTSSLSTCRPHTILFEASIAGLVTTEPNAGSLPIKGVKVTYQLLDEDGVPIDCGNDCSGDTLTDEGGSFSIDFKVDHPALHGKNDEAVPVLLSFSKTTPDNPPDDVTPIDHIFLCNEGEVDCNMNGGHVFYVKHLEFKMPVKVYDDTSVPFSGKVTVYETDELCKVVGATVELIQKRSAGGKHIEDTLISGTTDPNGEYMLPIIIGSRVDKIKITYNEHEFAPSPHGKFESGVEINAEGYYGDMDFVDVTKARLMVDVVGGMCNVALGVSEVQVKIVGCDNWDGLHYTQNTERGIYQKIPAHLVEVQVLDVKDASGERIMPIFSHFQGTQPEKRVIDLTATGVADEAMDQEIESQNTGTNTGTEDPNLQATQEAADEELEREEKEDLELVRFQYDGQLQMAVEVSSDQKTCDIAPLEMYGDVASLHVLDKFTAFNVTVRLQYELVAGIPATAVSEEVDAITCDIVSNDVNMLLVNYVGVNANNLSAADKALLEDLSEEEQKALTFCSAGCLFGFDHDIDSEGKMSNAHRTTSLVTGQPNIKEPYTRNIIFRVESLQHKAAVVITGDYSKGPGQSFAFPTHKPIMVLRDPPGGLSHATYENIRTTLKMRSSSKVTHVKNKLGFKFKNQFGKDVEFCAGGGFGAIALGCTKPVEVTLLFNSFEFNQEIGGITQHDEDDESSEFATTWSYKTSEDPWLAGAMSDVFVVPNLNVEFSEVWTVEWNDTACTVIEEVNSANVPPLPVTTVFDIDEGESSLAFYNRYHIIYSKLPDLHRSERNKESEKKREGCDVDDTPTCEEIDAQLQELRDGLEDWYAAIADADQTVADAGNDNSILNWFSKARTNLDYSADALDIDNQPSYVAPPELIADAEWDTNTSIEKGNKDPKDPIKETKRIQFSGGGNTMEMHMSKIKGDTTLSRDCWEGCNVETDSNLKGVTLEDLDEDFFNNGFNLGFSALDFTVHYEHESTESTENSRETSIGFVLGDNDPGDEFVLELYTDEKYGTVVFKTVLGVSKCPHELGTAPLEVPRMEISRFPPQHVLPDEKMVFELDLSNEGVGNETMMWLSSSAQKNIKDGLVITTDGIKMNGVHLTNVEKNRVYKRLVEVQRGPIAYKSDPVMIGWESSCEDADSLTNDLTASIFGTTASTSVELYNTLEGEGEDVHKYIEFVELCPKVEWAGELNRDRSFVVNTNSDSSKFLPVSVFNPGSTNKMFCEMTSDRLEHVHLSYRRKGSLHWSRAMNETKLPVDFSSSCDNEDSYGYSTLKWLIEGIVPEGAYEIKVGTECNKLDGPDDVNLFDTPVLSGVIDLTRPEQYGLPLPLHDQVLIGEEISVIFTEPIDCSRPYSFQMKVEIVDTAYSFGTEELQVTCEGRKIGFQIDPTVGIDVEAVMGKKVTVEIGKIRPESKANVFDVNGNSLDPLKGNIKFEKTLANLNLDEASTSFIVSVNGMNCADRVVSSYLDELKSKIAAMLEVDASRIEIKNAECDNGGYVVAEIVLLPSSSGGGRLLRSSSTDQSSIKLFKALQHNLTQQQHVDGSRRLVIGDSVDLHSEDSSVWSLTVDNLKILPSTADLEKLKTSDPDLVKEESRLKRLALASSDVLHDEHHPFSDNNYDDEKKVGLMEEAISMRAKENEILREVQEYEKKLQKLEEKHDKELREMHERDMEEARDAHVKEMTEQKKGMQVLFLQMASFTLVCVAVVRHRR